MLGMEARIFVRGLFVELLEGALVFDQGGALAPVRSECCPDDDSEDDSHPEPERVLREGEHNCADDDPESDAIGDRPHAVEPVLQVFWWLHIFLSLIGKLGPAHGEPVPVLIDSA